MNEQEGGLSVHTQAGKEIVLGEEEPLGQPSPHVPRTPRVSLCALSSLLSVHFSTVGWAEPLRVPGISQWEGLL